MDYTILCIIYYIILLLSILYGIYKLLFIVNFIYSNHSSYSSNISKLQYQRWNAFIQSISKSFSHLENDLNGYRGCKKHLLKKYHPLGTLLEYYMNGIKKPLNISITLSIVVMVAYHWINGLLYGIILNTSEKIKFKTWIAISISCSIGVFAIFIAGLIIMRNILKQKVFDEKNLRNENIINNNYEEIIDIEKFYSERSLSKIDRRKIFKIFIGLLLSLIVGFTICSSNTLSHDDMKYCLIGFGLSWGLDLLVLRIASILIIAFIISKRKIIDHELIKFEYWTIPDKDEINIIIDSKRNKSGNEVSLAVNNLFKDITNSTMEIRATNKSIIPFESIKIDQNKSNIQYNYTKENNGLEIIIDNIDEENIQPIQSSKQNINEKENLIKNKLSNKNQKEAAEMSFIHHNPIPQERLNLFKIGRAHV